MVAYHSAPRALGAAAARVGGGLPRLDRAAPLMRKRGHKTDAPDHVETMRYAIALCLSLSEARIALARQRHAEAMARLHAKMDANR
jgi:hypothetical protein